MMARGHVRRLARRIDGLGLRERCMLFASIALLMAAAADSLVLSPALAEQKQLGLHLKQENNELSALRAQLAQATAPPAPDSPVMKLQRDIAQLQARQQAVEADIDRLGRTTGDRTALAQLLERTLARHERLTLRTLATVAEPPSAAASSAAAAKSVLPALRWQGVDLAVSGRYADLVGYLSALEIALPDLRWETLKLTSSPTETSTLALRLYLVETTR